MPRRSPGKTRVKREREQFHPEFKKQSSRVQRDLPKHVGTRNKKYRRMNFLWHSVRLHFNKKTFYFGTFNTLSEAAKIAEKADTARNTSHRMLPLYVNMSFSEFVKFHKKAHDTSKWKDRSLPKGVSKVTGQDGRYAVRTTFRRKTFPLGTFDLETATKVSMDQEHSPDAQRAKRENIHRFEE